MSKEVKMTIVPPSQFMEEDYREPCTYFNVMATGDRCYYHTSSRETAQQTCDSEWGIGKYKVRTNKTVKPKGSVTAVGFLNSKSRAGMRKPS
jgi:hypothetical protein